MFQGILTLFGAELGQILPKISKIWPKSQNFTPGYPQMFLIHPIVCEWLDVPEIDVGG
jgi:hypothetical protein